MSDLSWTCHICGDSRLDAKVNVYSDSRPVVGSVVETVNVRYCNDRPGCEAGAPLKAKEWLP